MSYILNVLILISTLTDLSFAGSWCFNEDEGSEEDFYCDTGCCGSFPRETCCPAEVRIWIIFISVFGGIIFVGVIICFVCTILVHRGMSLFKVTEGPGRQRLPTVDYTLPNNQQTNLLYGINQERITCSTTCITTPTTYISSPPAYITSPPAYVASPPPYSTTDALSNTAK